MCDYSVNKKFFEGYWEFTGDAIHPRQRSKSLNWNGKALLVIRDGFIASDFGSSIILKLPPRGLICMTITSKGCCCSPGIYHGHRTFSSYDLV